MQKQTSALSFLVCLSPPRPSSWFMRMCAERFSSVATLLFVPWLF